MNGYRADIVDIELESGSVHRSFMNQVVGEGDANANRFGFRCLRKGKPVDLAGSTVIGHFIRADGNTVIFLAEGTEERTPVRHREGI